jgi:hypothetical protein
MYQRVPPTFCRVRYSTLGFKDPKAPHKDCNSARLGQQRNVAHILLPKNILAKKKVAANAYCRNVIRA